MEVRTFEDFWKENKESYVNLNISKSIVKLIWKSALHSVSSICIGDELIGKEDDYKVLTKFILNGRDNETTESNLDYNSIIELIGGNQKEYNYKVKFKITGDYPWNILEKGGTLSLTEETVIINALAIK